MRIAFDAAKTPATQAAATVLKNAILAALATIATLPAAERDTMLWYACVLYNSGLWSEIARTGIVPPPPP